jgi:hypothetical protein
MDYTGIVEYPTFWVGKKGGEMIGKGCNVRVIIWE